MRRFLPTESVAQIHNASMRLFENVGVDFPNAVVLAVFEEHGVRIDGERGVLTDATTFGQMRAYVAQNACCAVHNRGT